MRQTPPPAASPASADAHSVVCPERRAAAARRIEWLNWAVLALLAAYALAPLAAMLRFAVANDLTFAGADGPFPADQYQYMSWIREYEDHLLAANTLDIVVSDRVFFHPMFAMSGLLVVSGVSIEWAYLLWKPVAIAVLFFGFRAYVRRFIEDPLQRVAALSVALFFSLPALFHYVWDVVDPEGDEGTMLRAAGELLPAAHNWGYLPTAIAVGLMPVFLLGVEQIVAALDRAERPSALRLAGVSLVGATASWLHPWQGQVLLVTVALALALHRRFALRQAWVAIPLAATLAPILYYFLLSRVDSAWALAQSANETEGDLPVLVVLLALLPLAVPAAAGARRSGSGFAGKVLLVWPAATVLVFACFSPSFPQHALEGAALPLGTLAITGLAAWRSSGVVVMTFTVLATLPGAAYMADWLRDTVREGGQVRYLQPGEVAALNYLRDAPEPGGVLSSVYIGALLPATTERRPWVAHPSWTRDFSERTRASEELFAGALTAVEAAMVVGDSGATFVLIDCSQAATAVRALRPLAQSERRFGCAAVLRVRG